MLKKVIGVLVVLALCSQPLLVASAAKSGMNEYGNTIQEEYQEKEVNSSSDLEEDSSLLANPENLISISDSCDYDRSNQMFLFHYGASVIQSSVPDGMIKKGNVYLSKEAATEFHLYRDGEELPFESEITVAEPGSYLLSRGSAESAKNIMHFTIIGELSGIVTGYQMPQGFRISSVTRDGSPMDTDGKYVPFTQEGLYVVNYANPDISVSYTLEISTDFTASTLLLEAVNDKGYASGPVSLEDWNKADEITILLNDKELSMPYNHILTETGKYQIELKDEAGNVTNYSFIIKPYLNMSAIVAILVLIALIAVFVIFVIRTRKHMRVR